MNKLYYWTSIISSMIYYFNVEDKSSVLAFLAIMSYLFYIDNKIDEKDN